VRVPRLLGGKLLEVLGDDDAGHRALRGGDAERAIDEVTHLLRAGPGLDEGARAGLGQRLKVDLLLVAAAQRGARRLGADGDDQEERDVIHPRVVETVQEMDRAGPAGREANARLSGELGVRAGHERRHLLVANLHEIEALPDAAERTDDSVDSVAGIAEDAP